MTTGSGGSSDDQQAASADFVAESLLVFARRLTVDALSTSTSDEVSAFLELIPQLVGQIDRNILKGLVALQMSASGLNRPGIVQRVDACFVALDPSFEELCSALPGVESVDDEQLANLLGSRPLNPIDGQPSVRLTWFKALMDSDRPGVLGLERAWRKVSLLDLTMNIQEGHLNSDDLIANSEIRGRVTSLIEAELNDLDPAGLGVLLGLDPSLLALVNDGKLGRVLERLAKSSVTVDRARNLLAVPLLHAETKRHDAETKVLRQSHRDQVDSMSRRQDEAAQEFGRQLGDRDEEVARVEGEVENLRRRVEDLSGAAAAPTERMYEQARVGAISPIGRLIKRLLIAGDGQSLESASLLEEAAAETGLVIFDRPGDVASFVPERHDRLTNEDCDRIEVLEPSFGLRHDDGATTVIERGLVRCSDKAAPTVVALPKPVPPPSPAGEVITASELATCAIDFGTSTVLASVRLTGGQIRVLPIGRGGQVWMPSVVGIADDGSLVVGEEAEQSIPDSRLLVSVKSLLGQGDETVEMEGSDGAHVTVDVDDAVGAILAEAIRRAREPGNDSEAFGAEGIQFHLSCPANWEGASRRRLTAIASDLGLPVGVLDVVDEPTAAGISWIYGNIDSGSPLPVGETLIIDFGGGTVDVAVIKVSQPSAEGRPGITVLAADALQRAGDDLDLAVARFALVHQLPGFEETNFEDLGEGLQKQLRLTARDLKHQLTDDRTASIRLRGVLGNDAPILTLTRSELDDRFRPQLEAVNSLIRSVIRSARLRQMEEPDRATVVNLSDTDLTTSIRHVLLAGGMSRVVALGEHLESWFTQSRVVVDEVLGPRECSVVIGLGHDEDVSELNMHRPAFDIVASFSRSERPDEATGKTVVYEAFKRVIRVEDTMIQQFGFSHSFDLNAPSRSNGWIVFLHFRTPEGDLRPIPFQLGGEMKSYLSFPLGNQGKGRFVLYVNGRLLLRAGGRTLVARMRRWPIVRGSDGPSRLEIEIVQRPTSRPPKDAGWWHGGE